MNRLLGLRVEDKERLCEVLESRGVLGFRLVGFGISG